MKPLRHTQLYKIWDNLRSSYWFVPTVLVLAAALLAMVLLAADRHYQFDQHGSLSWLFLGKAASARAILSTIATSMVTIVSLTFSMTIVVLTLASSQFGPRLLYNFMRDRVNQFALGVFAACFVYCLLVLRTVHAENQDAWMPHLSTNGAIVLAVLSIGVLIHFIHHIADSIQADTVIANVRYELESVVKRMTPARAVDACSDRDRLAELADRAAAPITAERRGLLQMIDQESLVSWAREHDVFVRLRYRPGEFVIRGNVLLDVFPSDRVPRDHLAALQETFIFGKHRTLVQDIEFAFQQLVEVAVRALSPGINDPFTAMSCIEELGAALALVGGRAAQPSCLRDEEGQPRVLLKTVDFEGVADIAFNQIRQNGASHPAVMIRVLETIAAVAQSLADAQHRAVLLRHAESVHAAARRGAHDPNDRADIDSRFEGAARLLGGCAETGAA